jgi:putative membrane protein
MFRFGYGPHFFWVLIPLLGTIVWIALLVVLVWALLRWLTTKNIPVIGYHPTPPPYQPSALEILRVRYARGEIDEVTFQQMRERLEASTPPGQQHPE